MKCKDPTRDDEFDREEAAEKNQRDWKDSFGYEDNEGGWHPHS